MAQAGVIAAYLNALGQALAFDRRLSRRVRQEAEDHLRAIVEADRLGDGPEAERRAVASFGNPQAVACQFAAISLIKQMRRVVAFQILAMGGLFLTMKVRLAWYAATQWPLAEEAKAVSAVVSSIDRYAFWIAVAIGI